MKKLPRDAIVAVRLEEMKRHEALGIAIAYLTPCTLVDCEVARIILRAMRDQPPAGGQITRAAAGVLENVGYIVGSEHTIMISDTKKAALALKELNNALDHPAVSRGGNHDDITETNMPWV